MVVLVNTSAIGPVTSVLANPPVIAPTGAETGLTHVKVAPAGVEAKAILVVPPEQIAVVVTAFTVGFGFTVNRTAVEFNVQVAGDETVTALNKELLSAIVTTGVVYVNAVLTISVYVTPLSLLFCHFLTVDAGVPLKAMVKEAVKPSQTVAAKG